MATLKMRDERAPTVRYWLTPPEWMEPLQAEFAFDFDACPHPRPPGFDGLKAEWGARTWVNPPFTAPKWMKWRAKALEARAQGKLVVLAIPIYQNRVIAHLIEDGAEFRGPYNILWLGIENGARAKIGTSPTLIVVLRPKEAP